MKSSIKNKLVYSTMAIATTVLLLAISIYLILNINSLKENKLKDVKVLARIISQNNQSAILFNDSTTAKENSSTKI